LHAARPVQVASNDASFVPEITPRRVDDRSLSPCERLDADEALFGQTGDDQAADVQPERVRIAQNAPLPQTTANADLTPDGFKKHQGEKEIEKLPEVNKIIEEEAKWWGVNPRWLKIIAFLESSGDPKAKKGSYRGLFMFDSRPGQSWEIHGGKGNDIEDAANSTRAAIKEFQANQKAFFAKYRRNPTLGESYLMHQQGSTGAFIHMRNPSGLAWENLFLAGLRIPEAEAKKRIRSNLPPALRPRAESMTSHEFMDHWLRKVSGGEKYGEFVQPLSQTDPEKPREPDGWLRGDDAGALAIIRNAISTDLKLRNPKK
jgi:hypothetical protein